MIAAAEHRLTEVDWEFLRTVAKSGCDTKSFHPSKLDMLRIGFIELAGSRYVMSAKGRRAMALKGMAR